MGSKGCCCGYVCCERLWIINNIDLVTTAQIVQFLKRGLFCYAIFSCLAIYNAAVARTNSNHELYTVNVIDAVLYCFNSAAIAYFVYYPTPLNLYIPLVSAPLLFMFFIASLVLQIVNNEKRGRTATTNIGISYATSIVSIIFLTSVIYFLMMLRMKFVAIEANKPDSTSIPNHFQWQVVPVVDGAATVPTEPKRSNSDVRTVSIDNV
jgi:hypothetical protein